MEKIIQLINNNLEYLGKSLLRTPQYLVVFVPLALLYLTNDLNPNEENYMQLAKQFMSPDWIFDSQNLAEVAGTRILYQLIIGYSLKYFSFEFVALVFRFVLILGFSTILSKIYKLLSLDNHQILLHLVLFIVIFNQSFFGGSWMLISVEPKCFAYIAVLISVYLLLRRRLFLALLFQVIASYFHILVGGYAFAYLLLTLFLFRIKAEYSLRQLIIGSIIYVLLLIPFAIYLKTNSLNYDPASSKISASWVYTYFRSPHHTALFPSMQYFYTTHLLGIMKSIAGLAAAVLLYPLLRNRNDLQLINQLVIISLAGALLLIPIAFIDKNGDILKFYLYRINTVSTFFLALLVPVWIYILTNKHHLQNVRVVIFTVCLIFLFKPAFTNAFTTLYYSKQERSVDDIADYIKDNTKRNSLIFSFQENLSLIRKSERNLFSVYKYIPAQLNRIPEWYKRVEEKKQAINDSAKLNELVYKYGIDYILVPRDVNLPVNYRLIYQNDAFKLHSTDEELK